ncbi:MAG: hypothetical protein WBG43_11965 [Marinifilaceae bacterium]
MDEKLGYEDKTNKNNTSNKAFQDKMMSLEKELEEAKIKAIA